MAKVFTRDIAKSLSEKKGISLEEAETYIESFFSLIDESLIREKNVKIKGFGTFKLVEVRDRESVDVNTGARMVIDSHSKISFTPDSTLKDLVNKPFSQFETVALNDSDEIEKDFAILEEQKNNSLDLSEAEVSIVSSETDTPVQSSTPEVFIVSDTDVEDANNADEKHDDATEVNIESHQEVERIEENKEVIIDTSINLDDNEDTDSSYNENELISSDEPFGNEESEAECNNIDEEKSSGIELVSQEDNNTLHDDMVSESVCDTQDDEIHVDNNEIHVDNNEIKEENDVIQEGDDVKKHSFLKIMSYSLLAIALMIIVFISGYFLGGNSDKSAEKVTENVAQTHKPIVKKTVEVKKADTLSNVIKADSVIEKQKKDSRLLSPKKNNIEKDVEQIQGKTDSPAMSYARRMVKTGAYVIVGTEKSVKIKHGQTLKSISRLYLGEGMECYIQIHNGKCEASEGETINIPKLKLKKKVANKKVS